MLGRTKSEILWMFLISKKDNKIKKNSAFSTRIFTFQPTFLLSSLDIFPDYLYKCLPPQNQYCSRIIMLQEYLIQEPVVILKITRRTEKLTYWWLFHGSWKTKIAATKLWSRHMAFTKHILRYTKYALTWLTLSRNLCLTQAHAISNQILAFVVINLANLSPPIYWTWFDQQIYQNIFD